MNAYCSLDKDGRRPVKELTLGEKEQLFLEALSVGGCARSARCAGAPARALAHTSAALGASVQGARWCSAPGPIPPSPVPRPAAAAGVLLPGPPRHERCGV